jgi:hypothetical protein
MLLSVPGVKVDTRDFYGRSLLWWAASGERESPGAEENMRHLYGHSHQWDQSRGREVRLGACVDNVHTFTTLLEEYHLDPNVADRFGRAPLAIASLKATYSYGQSMVDYISSRIVAGETNVETKEDMYMTYVRGQALMNCHVCTRHRVPCLTCGSCGVRELYICKWCVAKGAGCPVTGHALRKISSGEPRISICI